MYNKKFILQKNIFKWLYFKKYIFNKCFFFKFKFKIFKNQMIINKKFKKCSFLFIYSGLQFYLTSILAIGSCSQRTVFASFRDIKIEKGLNQLQLNSVKIVLF